MKLLFAVALTLAAFAVKAQTVTQESLEGTWNVIYMESQGVTIDLEKKAYTISQEVKDQIGGDVAIVEESLQEMLNGTTRFSITFKGTAATFIQLRGEESQTDPATYVLKPGSPQLLETTTADGVKDVNEVTLKEDRLELNKPEDGTKMILKKAK